MAKTALAKDPKQKDKKPKPQSAWEKEKAALAAMDPSDPKFPAQLKKAQEAGKKQGVRPEIITAITRRAEARKGQAPTGPQQPTQEELAEQTFRQGTDAYTDITGQFKEFDPYKMQQKYEMGFTEEMNKARQNVLSQFERRNAEQFGRERQSTQQAIVERGLDPNSPAAQAMMRDLNDREDRARQEAANAAEQAAYGVQQQAFGQAGQLANMPFEQFQAIQGPLMSGLGAQQATQLAQQQQGFDIAKLREAARLQKAVGRGGGGGGYDQAAADRRFAELVIGQYPQGQGGQQQPSTGQSIATGITQGGALAVANRRVG
jgi:hypothetical protein